MTPSIDYSALFVPVTREEVTAFRRDARQRGGSASANTARVAGYVFIGVFIAVWAVIMYSMIGSAGQAAIPMFVVVAIFGVIVGAVWFLGRGRHWERTMRRTRFAAANGLVYVAASAAPSYPGVIFGIGSSRQATGGYRRADASGLDISGYRYTTGSDKNKTTHNWGYVALRLPRKLPHMLLDARSNNGIFGASNLPISFSRNQVLSLEGDFDRYFTLYCPAEYERDALYVFTPDLMARLIDESAAFDVEIIDDWMFLYAHGGIDIDDPAIMQRVFTILDTVGEKAQRQTRRYADERIGDPGVDYVAPRGQRLRRTPLWLGVGGVVVVAWVAFTIITQFVLR
ncbi:hypothetical protein FB562_1522 [Homoserinimonas aerilata]|uniref:DUF3137 domain-containing protein n=1 Tax=Homoserinimonas aerilata TaxID=1162970 RepID=A0A542YK00_9MICO|nr:hypothetical protein [Homoserinimonas aerilata]TQL48428.1 hypothetical protein FB562_1522 [Homoserinimonas aerilata]